MAHLQEHTDTAWLLTCGARIQRSAHCPASHASRVFSCCSWLLRLLRAHECVGWRPPWDAGAVPGGDIAAVERSVCAVSNSTAIVQVFQRIAGKFDLMYEPRACTTPTHALLRNEPKHNKALNCYVSRGCIWISTRACCGEDLLCRVRVCFVDEANYQKRTLLIPASTTMKGLGRWFDVCVPMCVHLTILYWTKRVLDNVVLGIQACGPRIVCASAWQAKCSD